MATSFFDRIKKFFGDTKLKAKKYRSLITDIIDKNNEKAALRINRMTEKNYQESFNKLSKEKSERVDLPNSKKLIDKEAVRIRKSKESGKQISKTLRNRMEGDLRKTLFEFSGSGKSKMKDGKINPELISSFETRIKKTYSNYTKRNPKTGVPDHVKNIAITEVRSSIDNMKEKYAAELLKRNPDIKMQKTWIHNRSLSKVPRQPHVAMNGKRVEMSEKFKVAKSNGIGYDMMSRPHDPDAPAGQVISCNCDVFFEAVVI